MKDGKGRKTCRWLKILAALVVIAGIVCYVININIHADELEIAVYSEDILLDNSDSGYENDIYYGDTNEANNEEPYEEVDLLDDYEPADDEILLDDVSSEEDILLMAPEENISDSEEDLLLALDEDEELSGELSVASNDTVSDNALDIVSDNEVDTVSDNEVDTVSNNEIDTISDNTISANELDLDEALLLSDDSDDLENTMATVPDWVGEYVIGSNVYGILDEDGTFTIYGSGATYVYYTGGPHPDFYPYRENIKKVVCSDAAEDAIEFSQVLFIDCKNLTEVQLHGRVSRIDGYVFRGCNSLESVEGFGNVVSIGDRCFMDCTKLSSIDDTSAVEKIGPYAFYNSKIFKDFDLSNLKILEENAFSNSGLREAILPKIEKVGNNAFTDTGSNSSPLTLSMNVNGLVSFAKSALNGVTVDVLTLAGSGENIENFDLPDAGNNKISTIVLNNYKANVDLTLQALYRNPVDGQLYLTLTEGILYELELEKAEETTKVYELGPTGANEDVTGTLDISTGVLTIATSNDKVMGDYNTSIAEGGRIYSDSPLYPDRNAIKSVVIPEDTTLKNYGAGAFAGCSNLTFVGTREGMTAIGDYAFYGCKSLASIKIPEGTDIGKYGLAECSSMTKVYNMSGETNINGMAIGDYAFKNSGITGYFELKKLKSLGDGVFEGSSITKLRIENMSCDGDSDYLAIGQYVIKDSMVDKVTIANYSSGTYIIPEYSFCDSNLVEVVFEKYISGVAGNAFSNNSQLKSISFGNVSYLAPDSFKNCTSLAKVTIPSAVKCICCDGCFAFEGCTNINKIVLDNVTLDNSALGISDGTSGAVALNDSLGSNYRDLIDKSTIYSTLEEGITYNCTLVRDDYDVRLGENVYGRFDSEIGLLEVVGKGAMYDKTVTEGDNVIVNDRPDFFENIVTVKVYSDVTYIGQYMFYGLNKLTNVILDASVTALGRGAFGYDFNLVSITGAGGIVDIGTRCFERDGSFTGFDSIENLKKINEGAFYVCSSLKEIKADELEYIGNYAFESCGKLKKVTGTEGVEFIGPKAFWLCNNLESLDPFESLMGSIPSESGLSCFYDCVALEKLDFSKSGITGIPGNFFNNCSALSYLALPTTVTNISQNAFTGGVVLDTLVLNNVTLNSDYILPGVFINKAEKGLANPTEYIVLEASTTYNMTLVKYDNSTTYHMGTHVFGKYDEGSNELKVTGYGAMYDISSKYFTDSARYKEVRGSIISVDVEAGVTSIGREIFSQDEKLTTVALADTIATIGISAFDGCVNLTDINLDSNITAYAQEAFNGCSSLKGPINATGLKSIGKNAFYGCGLLTGTVDLSTLSDDYAIVPDGAFYGCCSLSPCANNTLENITTLGIGSFCEATIMLNPSLDLSNVTGVIPENVFYHEYNSTEKTDNGHITSVILSDKITEISRGAFRGNHDLKTINNFPDTVRIIGGEAFKYCSIQPSLDCSKVERIDHNAFQSNRSLKSLVSLESLKFLGSYAFGGLSALEGDYVLSSIEEIQVNSSGQSLAFSNCGISSLEIGGTIETLTTDLFDGSKIANITISGNVVTLDKNCIDNCSSLKTVTIGDSVEIISSGNFSQCPKLESVSLGKNVRIVDTNVFEDCSALEAITLNDLTLEGRVKLPGYYYDPVDRCYINELDSGKEYTKRTIEKSDNWYVLSGIPKEAEDVILNIIVPYSEGKPYYYGKIEGYIDYFVEEGKYFEIAVGDGNEEDKTKGTVKISDNISGDYSLGITLNKKRFDGTDEGVPLKPESTGYREKLTIEIKSDGNKIPDPTIIFNGLLHIGVYSN